MEAFVIKDLSFTYPNGKTALSNVNLQINSGEFVCLCGSSGCGKTTLLKMLKPALSPQGKCSGKISFFETPIESLTDREQASRIGYVLQDVENQIVTDKVWHELAFGLESLGVKSDEIRKRVAEMAAFFGISDWFHKDVRKLSGGQKQLLNLASVMVMQPEVLILDEPTSQLDPIAAGEFLKILDKINKEFSTTVILSEHRLEEVFSMVDRVVVMDEGKIVSDGAPKTVAKELIDKRHSMSLALPTPAKVYSALEQGVEFPLTVREGKRWLYNYAKKNQPDMRLIPDDKERSKDKYIELENVWFRYEKNAPDVLKGLNLRIGKGEIFSVLGGNGSGKTTMLSLICGINSPYRGKVTIDGKKLKDIKNLYTEIIGLLPQDPKLLFSKNKVRKELNEITADKQLMEEYVDLCGIGHCLDSHPYDLSGGEQQRVALCKVLMKDPDILLLDEPTKGFDAFFKNEFREVLFDLKKRGKTVILVSHDVEFCAEVSDCCSMIFDGSITVSATPREFFCKNHFYTTSANRMARTVASNALTAEDIILAFGKKTTCDVVVKKQHNKINTTTPKKEKSVNKKSTTSLSTIIAVLCTLVLVPATIYIGESVLKGEKYYFISLLIILEALVPFIVVFEGKKPHARELVTIATLCAIAVAGRVVFAPIAQVKPMLAIVIISGVCLGAESGFLVGAVSTFVSNFFFGQGPWTTWQMIAFAVVGFFAGLIFNKIKKSKTALCVYGFLSSMLLYSGLVNFSSIILMKMPITWESVISIYSVGLPFDLMHAVSTVVFIWLIAKPMMEKIERVKMKYGMVQTGAEQI